MCGPFSLARRKPPVPLHHPTGGPPPPQGEDRVYPLPVVSCPLSPFVSNEVETPIARRLGPRGIPTSLDANALGGLTVHTSLLTRPPPPPPIPSTPPHST